MTNSKSQKQLPTFTMVQEVPTIGQEDEESDKEIDPLMQDPGNTLPPQENIDIKTVTRVIGHLTDKDERQASRAKAYSQGSAATFAYICRVLQIDVAEVDMTKRAAKQALYDKLVTSVCE